MDGVSDCVKEDRRVGPSVVVIGVSVLCLRCVHRSLSTRLFVLHHRGILPYNKSELFFL